MPISDDHNTLKIGERGPILVDDFHFREKITHFDHERIPERVVHARGFGVHGYFENYRSLSEITSADLFQRAGEKTPTFTRFSTVIGNKGSMDLARDVRGMLQVITIIVLIKITISIFLITMTNKFRICDKILH